MFSVARILMRTNIRPVVPQALQFSTTGSGTDEIHEPADSQQITIPFYPDRPDETLVQRKQRLLYQSRKRGMLENDLLLSTFVGKYLNEWSEEQTKMYDNLINKPSNDWDIYYWAIGKQPTPDEYDNEIMRLLQKHAKNDTKEMLKMPELT